MALKISSSDSMTTQDISNLQRGWRLIVKNEDYLKMCRDNSLKEGEGMNIFVFRSKGPEETQHNCDYYYVEKGASMWDIYMDRAPKEAVNHYVHGKTFIVCVSVPVKNDMIQRIGIFEASTLAEIFWVCIQKLKTNGD